jgi:hypothetical protein
MNVAPSLRVDERGPPIEGLTHKGKPVPAYIVDGLGRRATFVRVARDAKDGSTPLAQLGRGESVIAPGLIYRDDPA